MVLITIVYCARDDKYGDDYNCVEFPETDIRNNDPNFKNNYVIKYNNIQRIRYALETNINLLDRYFKDDFEILFVDWSPIDSQYLHINPELEILKSKYVKNVIVSPDIISSVQLNPKSFYEYRGKNVGIRNASGKNILISNPDDILTEELVKDMKDNIEIFDEPYYGRCYSRKDCDHNLKEIAEGLSFPRNGIEQDEIMGGPASGDFILINRDRLINMTGFMEIITSGNETMLDGKCIVNLYKNNIKPKLLNGSILHLDHKKHNRTGCPENYSEYKNTSDWGLYNYKLVKDYNNIYRIKDKIRDKIDKIIVTTTIYTVSEAIKKFVTFKDWYIFIVGDKKTPHKEYIQLEKDYDNVMYISPEYQEANYKELSDMIGWNSIQRRNIGYIEALKYGAEIIASVDDDNIPLDNWGKDLYLGKPTSVYYYESDDIAFDPVGATNYKGLWHRGFPIQILNNRSNKYRITRKTITPDIQADFWNGDPDIDAICRLEHKPMCFFDDKYFPMASNTFSPFNSQNTFFTREALKNYMVIPYPGIGRMDDIWPSYYMQSLGYNVIYNKATVFQDRNIQDLMNNMKMEYIGYEKTVDLLEDLRKDKNNYFNYLPKESIEVLNKYTEITGKL